MSKRTERSGRQEKNWCVQLFGVTAAALPEYMAWRSMLQRCYDPDHKSYDNYGGRGITVCNAWRPKTRNARGFENKAPFLRFLKDVGRRPSPDHSLERRKNALGYSPSNCIWATRSTQTNNRRSNRLISFRGETLTLAQWCQRLGLHYVTVHSRIRTHDWPIDRALTEPTATKNVVIRFRGRSQSMAAWARELDLPYKTLFARINACGWSVERALTTPLRDAR